MNRLLAIACAIAATLVAGRVNAFDMQTHALMTRVAFSRSVLAPLSPDGSGHYRENPVLSRLGIGRLNPENTFGIYWITVPPSNILPKTDSFYYVDGGEEGNPYLTVQPELFENCQMQGFLNAQGQSRQSLRVMFADTVSYDGDPEILPVQNWLVRGAIREDDMGDGVGLGACQATCRLIR